MSLNFIIGTLAAAPEFTPAYTRQDGKLISAKCSFTVYDNTYRRGRNNADDKLRLRITAWGKRAISIARGATVGKTIIITGEAQPYKGRVWTNNPNTGQLEFMTQPGPNGPIPVLQNKVGYRVADFWWGEDSAGQVTREIAIFLQNNQNPAGRPPQYKNLDHQDSQTWKNFLNIRNNVVFAPGMAMFGGAKVMQIPNGAQLAEMQYPARGGNTYQNQGQNNGQGNGYQNNGYQQNQGNQGYNNQYGGQGPTQGMQGAQDQRYNQGNQGNGYGNQGQQQGGYQQNNGQVDYNGQNMGTALPNQNQNNGNQGGQNYGGYGNQGSGTGQGYQTGGYQNQGGGQGGQNQNVSM